MSDPNDLWGDLKLEKNVPLPLDIRSSTKWPWERFDVDFSAFFRPGEEVDESGDTIDTSKKLKNRIDQSLRTYSKKQTTSPSFISRIRLENEVSGVRVWRTK